MSDCMSAEGEENLRESAEVNGESRSERHLPIREAHSRRGLLYLKVTGLASTGDVTSFTNQ